MLYFVFKIQLEVLPQNVKGFLTPDGGSVPSYLSLWMVLTPRGNEWRQAGLLKDEHASKAPLVD
jgi:hypothetical protein